MLTWFSKNLESEIEKGKEFAPDWYRDQHLAYKATGTLTPVCPLEKVIECDKDYLSGYRNKVEFTIGRKFVKFGE